MRGCCNCGQHLFSELPEAVVQRDSRIFGAEFSGGQRNRRHSRRHQIRQRSDGSNAFFGQTAVDTVRQHSHMFAEQLLSLFGLSVLKPQFGQSKQRITNEVITKGQLHASILQFVIVVRVCRKTGQHGFTEST